jgi:hypothetical protein
MASKWPAVKNSAYIFRCVLFAQSDNQIKSNPSLSSGDWKVSIDGGAFANLATLPDVDPDSSVQVKVSLSADEMNGDEIMVTAIDAAGAEWHSAAWVIHTVGQTFDTVDGNIDAALADTNELQTDWANGGRLDVILDARAAQTTADDILTDTTVIGAAGAGLTALGDARLANLDATVSSRLSTAGYTAPPTAAATADAVWDEATAGHAGVGSTGAAIIAAGNAGDPWATELPGAYTGDQAGNIVGNFDADAIGAEVWTYSPRTLTSTAAQTTAAVSGSDLTIHRGDTFSASLTGLGDVQSRTQLYWTVKESVNQADARAAVQVEETDALLILKGAAALTSGDGDITVTNAATGAITLTLAAAATATLTPGVYVYDVQMVTATGVETLTAANLTVVADVTRAVV